ncbi:MAG: peptidylprolyl isomerase [Halofilum sp. (in: g-proteobacteria)]|nr:peptidylprolyl isomerase [Halofilum sp. (in: g-proteobacteria)]
MKPTSLAALAGVIGLLMPFTAAAAENDSLQTLDRIVAVVNDSVILESELEEQTELVRRRMRREGANPPPAGKLRERMLDQLIVEEIQMQHARQRGIRIDDETLNDALRNIASDRGTDLAGLREQMVGQGLDFAALREQVRTQLLLSRLRQRVIASQITVSQQEIDDFLTQADRQRERNVAYRIQHILLGIEEEASDEQVEAVRARAEQLVQELRGGGDFAGTAASESEGPKALEGGDLGWRQPSELPGLFVNELETMSMGEISAPLRSANGFHILKLVDQRGGGQQTITENRARHILLRDQGDSDQPRRKLAELRRRIEDGASFEQLARRHSEDEGTAAQGGDLGWFGPGEMTPAFQEVVETLEPGQVSEPFRTPFGWHVVQVQDRRERTDVERYRTSQARQTLYRRKVEEEMQRWVRERREEAYIDRRLQSGS